MKEQWIPSFLKEIQSATENVQQFQVLYYNSDVQKVSLTAK